MKENTDLDTTEVDEKPKSNGRLKRIVALVVAAILVIAAAAITWAFAIGALAPAGAAARYGMFKYIQEQDVTDYIETYKTQMGYGEATDDEWAQFLAAYNLTPERLRLTTLNELLTEAAIQEKCNALGITVSEEEIDASVETLKQSLAFNDDTIFQNTLEQYGQTMAGLRESYRKQLLQTKLCSQEVTTPEPSDDEVRSYITNVAQSYMSDEEQETGTPNYSIDWEIKESYCFAMNVSGSEPSLQDTNQVEAIRQQFMASDMTYQSFKGILELYCNDEDVKSNNGSMGWNVDTSSYSEAYIKELNNTAAGSVSNVFNDNGMVCFIWVDQSYTLPRTNEGLSNLDLSSMPSSLHQYFSDCVGYSLWKTASTEYLSNLVKAYDVMLYPMPSDVPYNTDMSKYLVASSNTTNTSNNESSSATNSSATSSADTTSSTNTTNSSATSTTSTTSTTTG